MINLRDQILESKLSYGHLLIFLSMKANLVNILYYVTFILLWFVFHKHEFQSLNWSLYPQHSCVIQLLISSQSPDLNRSSTCIYALYTLMTHWISFLIIHNLSCTNVQNVFINMYDVQNEVIKL